ncbi:MAG: hypothetical protein NC213_01305 [Acetobacter sp.]|nr:hypothetical protein [Bacteroides sp.]MCM1340363.1 hypothetical protein [Acetobacter sp.]MCM1432990.1 hypothetical protein [Clostridiales bacterium]
MSKNKKRKYSITAIILIILVISSIVYIRADRWLYYRVYTGNRITVNLHAAIDNEKVFADDISAQNLYVQYIDNKEILKNEYDLSVKSKDDFVKFSIKADSYGEHYMGVSINSYNFVLRAYQWNWWDVQNITLYIDINSKNNTFTFHQENSHISENMGYIPDYESTKPETHSIDDVNNIFIGTD